MKFGTDGIRGDAARDLTPTVVASVGIAAVEIIGPGPFLVARDTRESGQRMLAELTGGMRSRGGDVLSLGVVPTPALAHVAAGRGLPAVMISASHNKWSDNGIKVFAPGGRKIDDATQSAMEVLIAAADNGRVDYELPSETDIRGEYEEYLAGALEGRRLAGLKVVLDVANGAAFECAPSVFRARGADVVVLNDAPDGRNINGSCGSTHPEGLQRAVIEHGAGLGLAFDGDADRVLAVDERGVLVDGDQIMVVMALDWAERGRLRNRGIAVTVLSNLGLHTALAAAEIAVVETPVGDRHVVAALAEHNYSLGGEQSGHIVFADLANTGDGTLTGLLLADRLVRSGSTMSTLAGSMTRFPQVMENVRLAAPMDLHAADGVWSEVRRVEAELGERGRVLVRPSGTEPLIRVMVEAESADVAQQCVTRLCAAVRHAASDDEQPIGRAQSNS